MSSLFAPNVLNLLCAKSEIDAAWSANWLMDTGQSSSVSRCVTMVLVKCSDFVKVEMSVSGIGSYHQEDCCITNHKTSYERN